MTWEEFRTKIEELTNKEPNIALINCLYKEFSDITNDKNVNCTQRMLYYLFIWLTEHVEPRKALSGFIEYIKLERSRLSLLGKYIETALQKGIAHNRKWIFVCVDKRFITFAFDLKSEKNLFDLESKLLITQEDFTDLRVCNVLNYFITFDNIVKNYKPYETTAGEEYASNRFIGKDGEWQNNNSTSVSV